MDRIVDATTSFVANISSQPYFDARMLVVAPAGIAVRMTHTPVTRDGQWHHGLLVQTDGLGLAGEDA